MNEKNLNINVEDNKDLEYIDPLDTLVQHNFKDESDINLEESIEMIEIIEKEKRISKNMEPETVINSLSDKYMDFNYKKELDNLFENFNNFLKKYSIEKEEMTNKSDKELTDLYIIAKFLFSNIENKINSMVLNVELNIDEYKMLATTLEQKLSYDGTDVFNIVELNENYLKPWKEQFKSLPKSLNSMIVNIDIKNVVMLYHFIVKHKVKGISKEFYDFLSILQKIADTNKLYNAYTILKQRSNNDLIFWTSAIDKDGNIEKNNSETEKI